MPPASCTNPNGVDEAQTLLGHERGAAGAQEPVKRIALVAHPSSSHERARHVGPAQRTATRLDQNGLHCHWDAEGAQGVEHGLRARDTRLAQTLERGLEAPRVGEMET